MNRPKADFDPDGFAQVTSAGARGGGAGLFMNKLRANLLVGDTKLAAAHKAFLDEAGSYLVEALKYGAK